jgi:hypothetical protein
MVCARNFGQRSRDFGESDWSARTRLERHEDDESYEKSLVKKSEIMDEIFVLP